MNGITNEYYPMIDTTPEVELSALLAAGNAKAALRILPFVTVVEHKDFVTAVEMGDLELVKGFLQHPEVVQMIAMQDKMALRFAVGKGYADIVNHLLQYPQVAAGLTEYNNEILIVAIQNRRIQATACLLQYPAVRAQLHSKPYEALTMARLRYPCAPIEELLFQAIRQRAQELFSSIHKDITNRSIMDSDNSAESPRKRSFTSL